MKQLTCEMCGSTDLVKQDGVFVCQSCGTKYSIEEAKKMMVEGTVDVKGTVKVDTSDELENLYQIARRAKEENNAENAAKYYDMILMKDPTSWEASFYVVYFRAMSCKIGEIRSAARLVENCQESVLTLIRDHISGSEHQKLCVAEMTLRSLLIANMLADAAKSHYDDIDSSIQDKYKQEYINNVAAARDIAYTCGDKIDKIFKDVEIKQYAAQSWKAGVKLHENIIFLLADIDGNEAVICSYLKRIKPYDQEYARRYLKEINARALNRIDKALAALRPKRISIKLSAICIALVVLLCVISNMPRSYTLIMLIAGGIILIVRIIREVVCPPNKATMEKINQLEEKKKKLEEEAKNI